MKLFPSSMLESVLMEGNGSFEVQIDILFDLSSDVSGDPVFIPLIMFRQLG